MRIDNTPKLDFDDVLIRPKRSEAASRSTIVLERKFEFLNSGAKWTGIPIIASNMDTVGTLAMSEELPMTCLHKYYSDEVLIKFFNGSWVHDCKIWVPSDKKIEVRRNSVFFTMGIRDEDFEKLLRLKEKAGIRLVCVDAANGYTKFFVERVKRIRDTFPDLTIMAGNVATPEMVQELLISGAADIIKIGIGSGSVCTTRIKTGVGYPQLSAIIECGDAAHGLRGHVCADGGCRTPADVVKAFAADADFVMLGGMLAGHDECEGEWTDSGMEFYGMSSLTAVEKYAGGKKDYRAYEGKQVIIPRKGPVKDTLQEITGGIRSACAYVGAESLKDLSKCTTFILCHRTHNTVYE